MFRTYPTYLNPECPKCGQNTIGPTYKPSDMVGVEDWLEFKCPCGFVVKEPCLDSEKVRAGRGKG